MISSTNGIHMYYSKKMRLKRVIIKMYPFASNNNKNNDSLFCKKTDFIHRVIFIHAAALLKTEKLFFDTVSIKHLHIRYIILYAHR